MAPESIATSGDSIDGVALAFGHDILDVEARLVSAGWHDPARLYNAALDYELRGDSFVDQNVGRVFAVLLACAQNGVPPTMDLVRKAATRLGTTFDRHGVPEELEGLRLLELCAAGADRYAGIVARNLQRLKRARECLGEFDSIVGDNTAERAWALQAQHKSARPVFGITSQRRRLSA